MNFDVDYYDLTFLDRDRSDTELAIRTERQGLGVEEIPVTVTERRPSRTSILRRVPRTLVGLVVLRRAMRRERPTP